MTEGDFLLSVFVPCAHAQVVKSVVGLYDDGCIKTFRAVEGQEADYVHRCCSAD